MSDMGHYFAGTIVDVISGIFSRRGTDLYLGEPVTQSEHALQIATLAEKAGAPDTLVAACLLHDLGHVLRDRHRLGAPGIATDDAHDEAAATFLRPHFPDAVVEPILLHVRAKRYLCAVDADYPARLSPASRARLSKQGGPMTTAEAARFAALPHAEQAIALRRWDDMAKTPGASTPPLSHFRPLLDDLAVTG